MPQQVFSKTVVIGAPAATVWQMLTVPALMKRWMSEMELEIITDWQAGSPFLIRGTLYKKPFENNGTVLIFEPFHRLSYTHLSSVSRLADVPESYTTLVYELAENDNTTALTLTISNFPTETIYKHLAFYWNVGLELLKRHAETVQKESDI